MANNPKSQRPPPVKMMEAGGGRKSRAPCAITITSQGGLQLHEKTNVGVETTRGSDSNPGYLIF